jgi:hypothetical protein
MDSGTTGIDFQASSESVGVGPGVEVSVGMLVSVVVLVGCRVEVGSINVGLGDGLISGSGVRVGDFVTVLGVVANWAEGCVVFSTSGDELFEAGSCIQPETVIQNKRHNGANETIRITRDMKPLSRQISLLGKILLVA